MDIDDLLLYDETLFKNMDAFNPDYIPGKFMHRKSQMEALALSIRPALRNGRPVNAIVLGSCATGKTTAVKKIFELVEKSSNKLVCVYINCQIHTTRFGIFSQIYQKIFGHIPPETGVPFSRIYGNIMQYLSNEKKALLVALDDINYLFYSKNANKIFYDILRAHEAYEGVKTGLFTILSDIEFRFVLDKNVNSIFIPQEIIFNPYTRQEMHDILTQRANIGFYPDVISEELIDKITDYASSSGDLRLGIDILRISGNFAEADASKIIEEKHVEEALKSTGSINLIYTLNSLSDEEKKVLDIVRLSEKDLTAGEVYEEFNKKTESSYASFNRILNKLEFLRLIDTRYTGKGIKGNSRVIILRFEPEEIMKCLNHI